MGLFDLFSGPGEEDYSTLPAELVPVYKNPWKHLGLDKGVGPDEIRDAFRKLCTAQNPEFVGNTKLQKYSFRQVLFAYRLCMSELEGPAKELGENIKTNTLIHEVEPDDFIGWLRPLKCAGMEVDLGRRAAKALHLTMTDTDFEFDPLTGPYWQYVIRVSYNLRITEIRKRYSEFHELHSQIEKEILILPGFPEKNLLFKFGIGNFHDRGKRLCEYLMVIHKCLGARGVFSPRIMEFLEIDYARVQYEEEGRMVINVLDTQGLMTGSQWQIISADWLNVWRKFIQSRGARRYKPPKPIDNKALLEKMEAGKKLEPGKHYRAVNFNVWWYLFKIYGGGPEITRKSRYIGDTTKVLGRLQAIYKLQAVMRGFVARRRHTREYLTNLAASAPGVREVLYTKKQNELIEAAQKNIEKAKKERKDKKLERAVKFTQINWRAKKKYGTGEQELQVRKHIQKVFADAEGTIEQARAGVPLVAEETTNIINIGVTEEYEYVIQNPIEGNKLPIKFAKQKHSEISYVKWRNTEDKHLADAVHFGSLLLAIDDYPCSSLTHEEKMERLSAASYPIKLRLRRALEGSDVLHLQDIIAIESEEVRLNELKRRLVRGVTLKKHCKGWKTKPHLTRLSIDEHSIHWEGRDREKNKSKDSSKSLSLFELKWCATTEKKETEVFKKAKFKKKERAEIYKRCFSIGTEKRSLDFEVSAAAGTDRAEEPADGKSLGEKRRDLLVWGFQQIIKEINSSQLFVDKDGNPIKRQRAKKQLKAIDRH